MAATVVETPGIQECYPTLLARFVALWCAALRGGGSLEPGTRIDAPLSPNLVDWIVESIWVESGPKNVSHDIAEHVRNTLKTYPLQRFTNENGIREEPIIDRTSILPRPGGTQEKGMGPYAARAAKGLQIM
ncbi:hypothetical protein CMUS01_09556 [Colletotrichum musicola]|uniref:Uncharacterized protein n=1 Tax=Colletotrichum musicola TaxID=2175873 RepID=A0A8H6NAG9_9PEZI|nr:hypothetical protein CMUS01_09556 [Colletotrichum musicola]